MFMYQKESFTCKMQNLTELRGVMEKSTSIAGGIKTSAPIINRINRKKISKDVKTSTTLSTKLTTLIHENSPPSNSRVQIMQKEYLPKKIIFNKFKRIPVLPWNLTTR